MKYSELAPGILVNTPDGIGIVVKSGVREVAEISGMKWEHVALVIVAKEPKWYEISDLSLVNLS